tara:strand:+ start:2017 stop:2160 length:144 start_codon:yes stop_codon:yes gene_type:complete
MFEHAMKKTSVSQKILLLIADLGWDYDRFSSSGQKTYDEICELLGIE